jgi:eukaryotic-like serine/threonine-protein kinase
MAVIDTRTDVYGLGRLGARILGTSTSRRFDVDVVWTGVPPRVARVLRIATAHRPGDRYPDAAAFAAALQRAAGPAGSASAGPTRIPTTARPRRRLVLSGAVALAAVAVTPTLASDSVGRSRRGAPRTAADPTGRITVTLPNGWRAKGARWAGQRGPDGKLEPVLVISPAPERWLSAAAVPGAFVGLSRSAAAQTTPAEFVAAKLHARCTAAPVRSSRQAGIDWVVATYTSCPGSYRVIVETAGMGPGDSGLVYVQITPPVGSGSAFVDSLLAGVRVR